MPLEDWETRQIRLSTFVRSVLPADQRPSVEEIFGLDPEATIVEGPNKDLTQMTSFGVGKLTLKVHLNRIDWLWESEANNEGFQSLGAVDEALQAFLPELQKWTQELQVPIARVALGGLWGIPVEGKEEGYSKLQEYLPTVQIDGQASSEFMYQINRWAFEELMGQRERFNRIAKWGVRTLTHAPIELTESGMVVNTTGTNTLSEVSCELDLSSPATLNREIDEKTAANLADVFRGFAIQILESGDHA